MGKKKWQDQHIQYMNQIMLLLEHYDDVTDVGQEPYKSDFFKIFANAFCAGFCLPSERFSTNSNLYVRCKSQRPLVSGDTIWFFAKDQGWLKAEIGENENRYENILRIMTWWDEWTYAWSRNPPARKRKARSWRQEVERSCKCRAYKPLSP
jgi:hypothetical protein